MDPTHFDRIAIAVGRRPTRSTGRRLLIASGLPLALGAVGRAMATDSPVTTQRRKCRSGETRCGKRCVNLRANPKHCGTCRHRCQIGEDCDLGQCRACTVLGDTCASSTDCCNGEFLDTICLPSSQACGGGPRCCRPDGGRCKKDCDCCGALTCKGNGRCG